MSDSMLATLIGIIIVVFGAAIWATSHNRERLSQWFEDHHIGDRTHHRR
ncbi:hypothetical protein B0G84_7692 [Paraburkholderia sp. BL8N3]|nr:hypothetical protein [Paraburkholderia sp. BL8N3]TCK33466.1 hypothetical protein B0G84_7692 [Paraburkholderia sp. BL8N3]